MRTINAEAICAGAFAGRLVNVDPARTEPGCEWLCVAVTQWLQRVFDDIAPLNKFVVKRWGVSTSGT